MNNTCITMEPVQISSLKEILFVRTNAELNAYVCMDSKTYSEDERELQRSRFSSVYQIIEDAGLTDEYEQWKNAHTA